MLVTALAIGVKKPNPNKPNFVSQTGPWDQHFVSSDGPQAALRLRLGSAHTPSACMAAAARVSKGWWHLMTRIHLFWYWYYPTQKLITCIFDGGKLLKSSISFWYCSQKVIWILLHSTSGPKMCISTKENTNQNRQAKTNTHKMLLLFLHILSR